MCPCPFKGRVLQDFTSQIFHRTNFHGPIRGIPELFQFFNNFTWIYLKSTPGHQGFDKTFSNLKQIEKLYQQLYFFLNDCPLKGSDMGLKFGKN